MKSFILKGDICWNSSPDKLNTEKNSFLICVEGLSKGVFKSIPAEFSDLPVIDYTGMLIMPGMVDLHIHAPQYAFRGVGMDLELLDWLKTYAFKEEAKYSEIGYAEKAYEAFVENLKHSATTRASIFATIHREATLILMEKLEETGLITYVGKVNMDNDAPDYIREETAELSIRETLRWSIEAADRFKNTLPILTPRFLPSCSRELLIELSKLRKEYNLPVQSHLSENPEEIKLVLKLFPEAEFYAEGYEEFGLLGGGANAIMAHCIYCTDKEVELIKARGVYVAHCPASNMNLSSGIAPIRKYLEKGLKVGLGSDVAGGESESIFRAIADAVQVSKLYWRLVDPACRPLSFEEAFYLATCGGGGFFGKVGSFEEGYELDAIVIDDRKLDEGNSFSIKDRLQRAVYLEADKTSIVGKFVRGRRII